MENIKINVSEGTKELILRTGNAEPVIEFRKGINVTGNLDVALCYLTNSPEWFTSVQKEVNSTPLEFSFLRVNRAALSIELVVDAGMVWSDTYKGSLVLDEVYNRFKVNTGKTYTTFELADLIKMNRSFFESKDIAMNLVSELRTFKAKVDKELENIDDKRGNKRVLQSQVVESNIPPSFVLDIPIFKGYDKQLIEVEININASDLSCTLISPEANDYVNSVSSGLINEQLDSIKKLFPQLKIFEV